MKEPMAFDELTPPVVRQPPTGSPPLTDHQLLLLLQKGQEEQLRLLHSLRQEVDALRTAQLAQSTTVAKLDRQLRWARWWRLIRAIVIWLLLIAIGLFVYSAVGDWSWFFTWWNRLVWLLS